MIKKISLFFTVILSSFFLIPKVEAACPEGSTNAQCREGQYGTIIVGTSSYNATTASKSWSRVYFTDHAIKITGISWYPELWLHEGNSSRPVAFYCLDAEGNGLSDVFATSFLINDNQSIYAKATDTGFMYILVNGAHTINNNQANYLATNIAARSFAALFNLDMYDSTSYLSKAYNGTPYKWITEDAEAMEAYETIRKYDTTNILSLDYLKQFSYFYPVQEPNQAYPVAKSLFIGALKETAAYYTNAGSKATVTESAPVTISDKIKTENVNGVYVTTTVTHTLSLKDFKNDGKASFKIDSVAFKKGAQALGAAKEPTVKSVKINDQLVSGTLVGTNLLNGITISDDMTVQITLQFEGFESVKEISDQRILNCEESLMDYILKYSYENTGTVEDKYSDWVGVVWQSYGTNFQRFMTVEKAANSTNNTSEVLTKESGEIEGSVSLVEKCEDCEDLEKACEEAGRDPESEECIEYNEKCECDIFLKACEESDDPESEDCVKYAEKCAGDCDILLMACEEAGRDPENEVCVEYIEKCDSCDALQLQCEADNNPNSKACQEYKEECECDALSKACTESNDPGGKACQDYALICESDCERLSAACVSSGDKNSEVCKKYINAGCSDCDDLKTMCDMGLTSPYVSNPCNKYNSTCQSICDITYSPLECCDEVNDKNYLLVEKNDEDYHTVNIKGPEDIKACFVTPIDQNCKNALESDNNSCKDVGVVDKKENSYTLKGTADYKYCTVSCKEDYIMTMPKSKLVNAGRYFTFKATINGIKTCYTNTIDREQYNKDMVEVQENLLLAYDDYHKWTLALLNIKNNSCGYVNLVSVPCPPGSSGPCCTSRCGCTKYYVSGTYNKITYYSDTSTGIVTLTGTVRTTLPNESDGGRSASSCSGSCTAGTRSTLQANIEVHIKDAEERLKKYGAQREAIIKEFNACSDWDTKINYNPTVYYDYEESYINQLNSKIGNMRKSSQTAIKNTEWYCNSSIQTGGYETVKATILDKEYNACSYTTSGTKKEQSLKYVYCDTSGCKAKAEDVSNARYKKIISDTKATYIPETLFYNIYPSGDIKTNSTEKNAKALVNGLPVSLNTDRGVYLYTVNIQNLGEFYDKQTIGRYAGTNKNTALIGDKIVYACSYLVNMLVTENNVLACPFENCPECKVDCVGEKCNNPCDGKNCVADCVGLGCIYDTEAGSSIVERTVSLNNLFPSGTESYNWNTALNEKAKSTVTAIENKGNKVYEEEPILSVTMDPAMAREITQYNDDNENDGGYSNDTLTCYKLGTYERAACYSEFITGVIEGEYGGTINDKSQIKNNNNYRTGTDVSEAASLSEDGYFVRWSGQIEDNIMLGPSWK